MSVTGRGLCLLSERALSVVAKSNLKGNSIAIISSRPRSFTSDKCIQPNPWILTTAGTPLRAANGMK